MPRKKIQKKSKEEKISENFFPVDEEDVKYAIEKEIKEINPEDLQKIEIQGTKRSKKERYTLRKKTTGKKISSVAKKPREDFNPEKIILKKRGYELIITEKPQAATKISSALGKAIKRVTNGVSYYELNRQGKEIVVACAVGHLFTLKQTSPGSEIPVFDIKWVPNFLAKKQGDFTKKYFDVILRLAKKAGSITIATDYDIEGEVIGLNITRFICGQKDANRMKFSTLTEKELNDSYEQKSGTLNWGQGIAGETRHFLDWIYGINLSRALMNSIKSLGSFKIMSIGRVQGPALNLIVEKENQIKSFKSQKYWQIFIKIKSPENSQELELKHNKDIFNKTKLKDFEKIKGEEINVKTEKKEQIIPPSPPFDLTTLQTEAYRIHGMVPSATLRIAQSLYLAGLISYPRTSSQKLPSSINYKDILSKIAKKYNAEKLIKRENPIEGKKSDPAHPSIYPTGENTPILPDDEEKIYNLIARRFISLFCEDAIVEGKKISTEINGLAFSLKGSETKRKGWTEIYPIKLNEKEIPDFNGKAKIKDIRFEEKETQPPKRYSPASIISELEKRNLGTKATRSNILETLYDRNYIKERSIKATSFGISIVDTLKKYFPIIIDEKLTRNFEREMENIQRSKTNLVKKEEKVINDAKSTITKISEIFKKNEKKIGKELINANTELREQEREENKLIACPKCEKGDLAIMYSRKTKRHFIACNAYPECKNTYSLPPNGIIKKTDKVCEHCGFPMLMRLSKGKHPWIFCFNPECKTNEEWARRKGDAARSYEKGD
ncbi:DNA topoisomerase I [Candidatus Pacearchaeota archaeon CG10_big_fil_rev_8_21_14_0_10_34_12]|nr:MAG: DNA topoisomerase I [Candidatus Pacearchaeota archaeon CG10_big_fil_rev_8_21_14_0_10_34_12]